MKNYNAIIMSQNTIKNILGEELVFHNGFVSNKEIDWWGKLEIYLNKPIVSIRPSGRESWEEVIILYANGYIQGNYRILDYQTEEELTSVLYDIFCEAENDEYEVFESYQSTCKKSVWDDVKKWVQRVY